MAWFVRLTRFASAHMVYAQEKDNTCGFACVVMVHFKINKGKIVKGFVAGAAMSGLPFLSSDIGATMAKQGIDDAVKTEKFVRSCYPHNSTFNENSHLFADELPAILKNAGLGRWKHLKVTPTEAAKEIRDAIAKASPVIAHIEWHEGNGHFVVVDEIHGDHGCFCDPWDGDVHVTKMVDGEPIEYDASRKPPSITLSGKRHA